MKNFGKRCYKQYCGVAKSLDIVGERWTLLIVRDLLLGAWRYSELQARLPGITSNLLATRLKEMEAAGLVTKHLQTSLGSSHSYELTELGRQLEPVILALGRFGFNFMQGGPQPDEQVDIGRSLLVLKLRYQGVEQGVITFRFREDETGADDLVYQVAFGPEYVDVQHDNAWPTAAIVSLSRATFRGLIFQGQSVKSLSREHKIKLEGDMKTWQDFQASFAVSP